VQYEAEACAAVKDEARLNESLSRLRQTIDQTIFGYFECEARFLEAYVEFSLRGTGRAHQMIGDAVRFARDLHYQFPLLARSSVATGCVLSEALRIGAETGYVTDVIRNLHIRPPVDAPANWPWPVKIFALGRFEIERDSEKLEFTGKAPRRLLAVLKSIVAGGAQAVPSARLIDSLWPDEEGDAGRKALEVCLVRLRKLLCHADAVVVRDEHISLNRELCWVDAWAFADIVETVESGGESPKALARLGLHALEFYRGALLPSDEDDRTIIVARLKLRDQMARLVSTLGKEMEAAGNWDQALACYRRGIDADELAEEFYQGVMRCHAAAGRLAEGMAVYRRLRQTLSVVLGLKPSARTEQLVQLLRDESAGLQS
jgi:LuxR family transcriptional regulator, maltose regulon positive regulatory protein